MTQRIARAILLAVWATLIAGGAVAYGTTRWMLLRDLDARIIARARALPQVANCIEAAPRVEETDGDRYSVDNALHQNKGRLGNRISDGHSPAVERAALFRLGDAELYRTLTLAFHPKKGGAPITVVYSGSAANFDRVLNRLAIALAGFALAAGALGAYVAAAASRAALAPLRQTAEGIGAIDETRLDRRIVPQNLPPELAPVALRLNEMLARLEQSFKQRKQFLADAGHELRTPVAALVTTIEVALRRPREAPELHRALRTCLTEARMLRQLVQVLLEHARGEAAQATHSSETFDLSELLTQCADIAEGLAADRGITVCRTIEPDLQVKSQPGRIRGIVMNLLGNSVEHNNMDGHVDLVCRVIGKDVEITVSDTGSGIPPEHLAHVFEPFYRVEKDVPPSANSSSISASRSSGDTPHLGLGLFLVDSHIKALGGQCRVESRVGVGTSVVVRLPGIVVPQPMALEASVR